PPRTRRGRPAGRATGRAGRAGRRPAATAPRARPRSSGAGRRSREPTVALSLMAPYSIRVVGDPVLRQRAAEVTNIDGRLAKLADDMVVTMYEAPGLGLAAPQVGVEKRLFVYDVGEGARTIINPVIDETDGEWAYEEGCLSVPGLSWEIVRPKQVHLRGVDLDGNEVSIEADEILARAFQHEIDHLDGV